MLEFLIIILMGIAFGTFTGLIPGIHVNTVVIILVSSLAILLEYLSPYHLIAFIIAMSVVHTFVNYIPSILIGAPDDTSVLSVLPGHKLLLAGQGYEAVRLTVIGSLGALILSVGILPLGIKLFPVLYSYARGFMPYLLMLVLAYMVYSERSLRRMAFSSLIIIYSGVLGLLVLNYNLLPPKYALFPTLTGLFGISTLLTSLRTNPKIPEQRVDYEGGIYPGGIVIGTIGGILTGLLPSIGSSQSAMIIQNFFRKKDEKTFLVALGGVNTSDAVYALFALYLIGNPRSGASIAVEYIMEAFTFQDFLFMISVVLVSAFFGVTITLLMARFFVGKIAELNYHSFSKYIIAFVVTLIFLITGWRGLLVALTATAIGLITPVAGIKRSHCMAVLVVPTIFYFL